MKAIVCKKYGLSEIKLEEVEKPTPNDNEVLVEVHASSVTTKDLLFVSGKPFFVRLMVGGLLKPKIKIPGSDIAGRITAVGKNVTQFKPDDYVIGEMWQYGCGAYAEYVSIPETALAKKPTNISFGEAAGIPEAALVALQGLRNKGLIKKGQKVLIFGASGGIGTFAVQIAKYFGAEVTGVCSTGNLEMVKSLGADHVIDYTKEDFSKNGQYYDLIFAIAYRSIFAHNRALSKHGIYVSTGGPSMLRIFQDMIIGPLISRNGGKQLAGGWVAKSNINDLTIIQELIEAGKIKPVINKHYPLSKAAEALQYYGEGHARGKVIIKVKNTN